MFSTGGPFPESVWDLQKDLKTYVKKYLLCCFPFQYGTGYCKGHILENLATIFDN